MSEKYLMCVNTDYYPNVQEYDSYDEAKIAYDEYIKDCGIDEGEKIYISKVLEFIYGEEK